MAAAGTTHKFAATTWKGAPADPYSYGDVTGKFARYAAPFLSPSVIDEIVNRVAAFENETDAAALAAAIRAEEAQVS